MRQSGFVLIIFKSILHSLVNINQLWTITNAVFLTPKNGRSRPDRFQKLVRSKPGVS